MLPTPHFTCLIDFRRSSAARFKSNGSPIVDITTGFHGVRPHGRDTYGALRARGVCSRILHFVCDRREHGQRTTHVYACIISYLVVSG